MPERTFRSGSPEQESGGQHGQTALDRLVEEHERVDWSEVDGISVAEAGAWTARLLQAEVGR